MGTSTNSEIKPFKSAHSLSRIVVILFLVLIPIFAFSAVTDVMDINLLTALDDEELSIAVTDEEIEYVNFWYSIFTFLQFLWYPALALFLIWFYKVYRNLQSLGGTGLLFKPKWVVAYFFIPILSLWKPFEATDEIWKVSDPTVMTSDRVSRKAVAFATIVIVWWIFWVISNFVGWYSFRQGWSDETIEDYIRSDSIYLVSDILSAISVGLTVPIVREIDRRQAKKIEVMNSLSKNNIVNDSASSNSTEDED